MKSPLFPIIFASILCSCAETKLRENDKQKFQSFEISYGNGWTEGFSLKVDSNKIYFSPQEKDLVYYGILPDSIFKLIDSTFLLIHNKQNVKSKTRNCNDCSVLAVNIVYNKDTIHIKQVGDLDSLFFPVINKLEKFIEHNKHQSLRGFLLLETGSMVVPPPPELRDIKFSPSIEK